MSLPPPGSPRPSLIDLEPRPGCVINDRLTLLRNEGTCAVMLGATPLYTWRDGDTVGERCAMVGLVTSRQCTRRDLAVALGVHENTVQRVVRASAGGQDWVAIVPAKRGRKGPTKVTPAVLDLIVEARSQGLNGAAIWRRLGERGIRVTPSHLYAVLRRLQRQEEVQQELAVGPGGGAAAGAVEVSAEATKSAPAASSEAPAPDQAAAAEESGEASAPPPSPEPPVILPEADRGRYMGLTLYYAALDAIGLLPAATASLRLRLAERFGVRAVVLTIFFLSLLRKSTLESAKHLRRWEFGAVVGSGRAPCVRTLRRKLLELGHLQQSAVLARTLAQHWVAHAVVATAYLYVDGHMKVYSGKRRLEEMWNTQRRMPLPGIITYAVGDQRGRPLLLVSEGVGPSLAKSLPRVVAAVREAIGTRPFTVIFDRGGYDGKLFTWLGEQKIGFITYQRGNVKLPATDFRRTETHFEGRRVRMWLAEDSVRVAGSGPWRRVVVRTASGHQTPILTSLGKEEVRATRLACLMFARWRQENFFKYMRQHPGLDALVSNAWRDASDQLIPNPERKRLERELRGKRAELREVRAQLGAVTLEEAPGGSALRVVRAQALQRIDAIMTAIAALHLQRRILPKNVPAATAGRTRDVMQLERKHLIDGIKVAAYNAEDWLLDRLVVHYRNPFDVRDLLRAFAELSGSIQTVDQHVVVRLDPPDLPAHRTALRGLCDDLNRLDVRFPGTSLPVRYEVAIHHSEAAA